MTTIPRAKTDRSPASTKAVPMDLAPSALVPDELNRPVEPSDEYFQGLSDSIRVNGVLERLKVKDRGDGTYHIINGHWRHAAALALGLATVPCEVYAESFDAREAVVVGIVVNVQRKEHGCIHIARRLRQLKTQYAETQEQVAERTGIALHRVKAYLALFAASEHLLAFFEKESVALRLANEFVRYEKRTNEAAARRLVARHLASPLQAGEIAALRRDPPAEPAPGGTTTARPAARGLFLARATVAFEQAPAQALAELEALVAQLGYQLVPSETAAGTAE